MKAIQITKFGGPEVMQLTELPDPIAGTGEEVLDVTAITKAPQNFANWIAIEPTPPAPA